MTASRGLKAGKQQQYAGEARQQQEQKQGWHFCYCYEIGIVSDTEQAPR
jgi:hypothetical protein